jgi:septal ring factor EnvC (AmiA/AmiB activator)
MWAGRMTTFRSVRKPALIVVAGVTILVSGCSGGASPSEVAQAQKMAADAQAQKDTQASLAAQVKQLKDDAAKTAADKAAADKAAGDKAAADKAATDNAAAAAKAAAAKAAAAQSQTTACDGNVSAGGNTTCAFAINVESTYYRNGGGYATFDVYSPVTGLYYTMTCTPGVPTVCRGGNNAVVYIR